MSDVRRLEEALQECRSDNTKLHAILEQALAGPYMIAAVKSGPDSTGMYRLESGSTVHLLPAAPGISRRKLKDGEMMIINDKMIIRELPEELKPKPEKFDFARVDWTQIGGSKEQIQRIRETVEWPIKHKKLFAEFKVKMSKGILLWGPPGCGKTMIAKAIATSVFGESEATEDAFVYLKGGEMLAPLVGVAEMRIKETFERAREYEKKTGTKAVIFLDEAEALLSTRGSGISSDVEKTVVPTFLAEMDGFDDIHPFVILATNHPTRIDPAIRRPGRIDNTLEIKRPDENESQSILSIYLAKTKVEGNVKTLSSMATTRLFNSELRHNISGAMLAGLVDESIRYAIQRRVTNPSDRSGLHSADIEKAIDSYISQNI